MLRLSHDEYFVSMLRLVAARSTCPRRQVGAIITDDKGHVLATGYNGVPSGFPHCTDEPCLGAEDPMGDTSRCEAIHAEANALLQCFRIDLASRLYVSCTPCFACAKLILNTPIQQVVCASTYCPGELGLAVLQRGKVNVQWL